MSIFGALVIGSQVEQAVLDTLQLWFPTYLKEFELEAGLTTDKFSPPIIPLPKSYAKANQFQKASAENLPAIVCVSPGLSPRNKPRQEGDGSFRVFFSIGAGVFCGARDRKATLDLVRVYTGIMRQILLQKEGLGNPPFADGSSWMDERWDDNFDTVDNQTIASGVVTFEVEVAGVVSRFGGPSLPYPTAD